jgi:hypothetical protein
MIYDGSGDEPYKGDVAIRGQTIAAIKNRFRNDPRKRLMQLG